MLVIALVAVAAVVAAVVAIPKVIPPRIERVITEKAKEAGVSVWTKMTAGYCWREGPGIEGTLTVSSLKSQWSVTAEYYLSFGRCWTRVKMKETAFDEKDPLLKDLLTEHPVDAVSNLTFSGSVALDASAEWTWRRPVPVWKAEATLRNLDVGAVCENEPLAVKKLRTKVSVSGVYDHFDLHPVRIQAESVGVMGVSATALNATMIRADERMLQISEASAEFCGGKLNIYSLFIDPARLNAGFTVFLENVDTGEILHYLKGFDGEATGYLHGRLKAFVREGGVAVRLSDAYLYSTPGQVGKLRIPDSGGVTAGLSMTGLDEDTRGKVSEALTDLDYNVLRLDLSRIGKDEARLTVHLKGTAQRGEVAIPVDLQVNLNGRLEQMINLGLGYSTKMKGMKK